MARLDIQQDEVLVWYAELRRPEEEVAVLATLLSPDERDRAVRYRSDTARTDFVVTRGLLRILLGACCDVDARRPRFAYGPAGKPELLDPAGPYFNVSHSGGVALFALTHVGPVGVDVERIRPVDGLGVLASVLSAEERTVLSSLPAEQRDAAFLRAWTRKEAFVKACGVGLAYGLERVEVTLGPTDVARFVRLNSSAAEAAAWSLWGLEPAPGILGALAMRGRAGRVVSLMQGTADERARILLDR